MCVAGPEEAMELCSRGAGGAFLLGLFFFLLSPHSVYMVKERVFRAVGMSGSKAGGQVINLSLLLLTARSKK